MKTNGILAGIKNSATKIGFSMKRHSPEILIVVGIAGTVVSAVMACKATMKLPDILEDKECALDKIQQAVEEGTLRDEVYTSEQCKKDTITVYARTSVRIAKLYTPSVVLGVLSIGSIVASNDILRKRNASLLAAYVTLDKASKEFHARVIDRFGEDVDRELRYGVKAERITETTVDPETGEEIAVEKTVYTGTPNLYSDYAKIFDESCTSWEKDAELNLFFLKAQQRYANDRLRAQGHLFLNEVYDMLGFDRTRAGNIVGWIYDPVNGPGDSYVDFGIYDILKGERRSAFVNGYERSIILDFNVDGLILDDLPNY